MEYRYLVANRQNNGGWTVTLIDDETPSPPYPVENRLHTRLNMLAKEGWQVVSSAATDSTLTVLLKRQV